MTTSQIITLLRKITPEDLIGCTICGTEVALIDSKCIEGHRVCAGCFGPDPLAEFGDLELPF